MGIHWQEKQERHSQERNTGAGDVWTFIAIDAETKLIPSFIVGKRDNYHAHAFMDDLASRLKNRIQLSSDALSAYPDAVERSFGCEIDYGQIVKTYSVSNLQKDAASRYSPADVVEVEENNRDGLARISPHFDIARRKAKPHVADALPQAHPADQCFQQKAGKLLCCGRAQFRVLQLLQVASGCANDPGSGRRRGKQPVDGCGTG